MPRLPAWAAGASLGLSNVDVFSLFLFFCSKRLCSCLSLYYSERILTAFFLVRLFYVLAGGVCTLPSEIFVCGSLRIACFCWLLHPSPDVKDVGYVIVRLLSLLSPSSY